MQRSPRKAILGTAAGRLGIFLLFAVYVAGIITWGSLISGQAQFSVIMIGLLGGPLAAMMVVPVLMMLIGWIAWNDAWQLFNSVEKWWKGK